MINFVSVLMLVMATASQEAIDENRKWCESKGGKLVVKPNEIQRCVPK